MSKINILKNQNTISNVNLSLFNTENLIDIEYNNNYPIINLNKNGNSELISTLDSKNLNKSLNKLNEYSHNIKLQSNTVQIINSKDKVIVEKELKNEISTPQQPLPVGSEGCGAPLPSHPYALRGETGQGQSWHKKSVINMISPVNYNNINVQANKTNGHIFKNMDIKVNQILNKIITFKPEIAKSQYIQYHYNNRKKLFMESITSLIINSFYEMKSIISTPVFYITPNKVVIHLLYYVKRNKIKVNRNKKININSLALQPLRESGSTAHQQPNSAYQTVGMDAGRNFLNIHKHKFELLCYILSKCFNKKVVLDLVRIHNPYNDSKILAETFGLLSQNLRVKIRKLVDKTFKFAKIKNISKMTNKRSIIPSFITGIKIKLGGRIPSLKSAPRYSVLKYQKGTLGRGKANFLTSSRSTYKCKRGSFSYTVSIGQSFF